MQVTVTYFGVLHEITGKNSEKLNAPEKLSQLQEQLISRYPNLQEYHYQTAVNHKIITNDPPLQDGDVVALLPPFTGG